MAVHPRTGKSPEVLVKILITIIEKTPQGGATMEDLKEAYCDVKDTLPDDRTIYRNIRRINELFNPQAYSSESQESRAGAKATRSKAADPRALTISSKSDSYGVTRYLYTGRKLVSKYESNQVLLIILGFYSQQRSILKDHFEKVMSAYSGTSGR